MTMSEDRPATPADVEEICLALPEVDPETGETYDDLLVVTVPGEAEKRALVDDAATPFFTIDHFKGDDAVLVQQSRLGEITRGEITRAELADILTEAWACKAPVSLVRQHFGDG